MSAMSTRRNQAKSLSFPNNQSPGFNDNCTFSPCSWVRFEIWSLGQSLKNKNLHWGKDLLLIAMPLHKDFELPQQLLGAFLTFSQGFCHSLIPEPLVHLVVPVSTRKLREMAPKIHSCLLRVPINLMWAFSTCAPFYSIYATNFAVKNLTASQLAVFHTSSVITIKSSCNLKTHITNALSPSVTTHSPSLSLIFAVVS